MTNKKELGLEELNDIFNMELKQENVGIYSMPIKFFETLNTKLTSEVFEICRAYDFKYCYNHQTQKMYFYF
jgi:hypothetical protein